ncbi:MAG: hypothetical protein V3U93_06875 [Alphaproteobacteria bacterium]
MGKRGRKIKEIVIPLIAEERDDGSYGVTSPIVPMFYVVAKDQASAWDTATAILKEHLEQNYHIEIREMRLTDYTREVFAEAIPAVPAHVIAELVT